MQLSGHSLQSGQWHGQTSPTLSTVPTLHHPEVLLTQGASNCEVAITAWPLDITGETNNTGTSMHEPVLFALHSSWGQSVDSPPPHRSSWYRHHWIPSLQWWSQTDNLTGVTAEFDVTQPAAHAPPHRLPSTTTGTSHWITPPPHLQTGHLTTTSSSSSTVVGFSMPSSARRLTPFPPPSASALLSSPMPQLMVGGGGSPSLSSHFWHVEFVTEDPLHQHSGAASSPCCTSAFGEQQGHGDDDGQPYCRGPDQNEGGTHSQSLYCLAVHLLEWADSRHYTLAPQHIPGHLNVVAAVKETSGLQCQVDSVTSSPSCVAPLGATLIDLFTTSEPA